jgi:hypothetical protein
MKVSKLAVASALSLAALSTSYAGPGLGIPDQRSNSNVSSANSKFKIATMTKEQYASVSILAQCSVAYDKMSQKMTKNPELRREFAKQSGDSKELLTLMMADKYEVEGMIKWNQSDITDQKLPATVEKCIYVFANLGKK